MHINELPWEILSQILGHAAETNARNGVNFSFGLSQAPQPGSKATLQRYVRAPIRPDVLKWNSVEAIRQVCPLWHEWAISHSIETLWVQRWRGGERWGDLPRHHNQFRLYEMIDKHSPNNYVHQQPYDHLHRLAKLLDRHPGMASYVRRMWFHGFFTAETDRQIFDVLRSCINLTTVALPWTTLRHFGPREWSWLLGEREGKPLRSLEFLCEEITKAQVEDPKNKVDLHPLDYAMLDFSRLRKLKIAGETTFNPITDKDLLAISHTATNLEEFYICNMSTVTIDGVMAIVKASQSTLRVLEHAPRSNDGFWHPHPGSWSEEEHICDMLTNCPKLETVSLSVPTVCEKLFSNPNVRWEGDFQVRSLHVCGHDNNHSHAAQEDFRKLLVAARRLAETKAASMFPRDLYIELFFADFIFEPHLSCVHGDFQLAELSSYNTWPAPETRSPSRKGPYGSSGLWEKKEEEGIFERLDEREFIVGMQRQYISLDHHHLG